MDSLRRRPRLRRGILRRPRLPEVAVAAGVLFAAIPLTPAMGTVGLSVLGETVAQANATVAEPVSDARSPLAAWSAADLQRQVQAARAALRARATGAGDGLSAAGTPADASMTTGGPIPTTDVTAKTRQIQRLVRRYFPADQVGNAMAVSACESGHSDARGAVNSDGTVDWGVFQLNDGGTLQGALSAIGVSFGSKREAQQLALDTQINVRAAGSLYASSGWAPWVCAYKIGVVAGLYSNARGPMYGKFDQWGRPTVPVPVVRVPPGPTDHGRPPRHRHRHRPRPGDHATPTPTPSARPSRTPSPQPSRTATPRPSRTPTPTPSATSSPSPSRSPSPSPRPSGSGSAAGPAAGQWSAGLT